jgi:uncharacterized protein
MDDVATDSWAFARHLDRDIAEEPRPLLWILTGNRLGDNNQLYALAEALGLPFEAKHLTYNRLRHIPFLRGRRLIYLTHRARRLLAPPWPDLVIGAGYGIVPVARYIRHRSGGRSKLIQIGNPRTEVDDFDLVITTPQYPRRDAPNVLPLPFPIGNPARAVTATKEEEDWLRPLPHPRRLVAVGGPARNWKIDNAELVRAIRHLRDQCASEGGSVITVTSPRTGDRTRRLLLDARSAGTIDALVDGFPRFAVLLAQCDQFFVTADSVSMLSEAILTRKPVGMIPIARSARGKINNWLHRLGLETPSHPDLPNFWKLLSMHDLVGDVESPAASYVRDTVEIAANAVRSLIDR